MTGIDIVYNKLILLNLTVAVFVSTPALLSVAIVLMHKK